jgi:hypothetical protein
MNIIRMRLKKDFSSKLAFVKIIKECTGLGLKEAKWKADEMIDNLKQGNTKFTELELLNGGIIKQFQSDIFDIGVECYMSGGLQLEREFKMLSLGLGDNEDYSNFIIDYINSVGREESVGIIRPIIDKLSKEDLEEIFINISKDIII